MYIFVVNPWIAQREDKATSLVNQGHHRRILIIQNDLQAVLTSYLQRRYIHAVKAAAVRENRSFPFQLENCLPRGLAYRSFYELNTKAVCQLIEVFELSISFIITEQADNPYQQTRLVNPTTGLPAVNEVGLRNWEWAIFLNDDWKVTRNFTLNLGIRYENYQSPTEVNGLLRNLVFGSGSDFNSRLANAKVDVVHQFFPPDGGNWAARIGFFWDPKADGKTAIRGGYGIAYDRLFMTPLLEFRNDPPLRATTTLGPLFGTSFTYALGDPTKPYLGFPWDPASQLGLDPRHGIKGDLTRSPAQSMIPTH